MLRCSFLLLSLVIVSPALAGPEVAQKYLPNAEKVGTARMSVMFWDVFDAALYAPEGRWDSEAPFSLSLTYFLALSGKDIAARSIDEIRTQGFADEAKLAQWQALMEEIFPDVKEGDTLTGVRIDGGHTLFYHNGQRIGEVHDPEFTMQFFDIWLGKNTSSPEIRLKLTGQAR